MQPHVLHPLYSLMSFPPKNYSFFFFFENLFYLTEGTQAQAGGVASRREGKTSSQLSGEPYVGLSPGPHDHDLIRRQTQLTEPPR